MRLLELFGTPCRILASPPQSGSAAPPARHCQDRSCGGKVRLLNLVRAKGALWGTVWPRFGENELAIACDSREASRALDSGGMLRQSRFISPRRTELLADRYDLQSQSRNHRDDGEPFV